MRITFLIALILGIVSCKKETIPSKPPYIEQWWEEYYGEYNVQDVVNDVTYITKISQISRSFDGEYFHDSILVDNFANRFTLKITNPSVYFSNLSTGSQFGIKDKEGNRWAVNGEHYFNSTKDSLYIYYSLSNIAFYMDDSVGFFEQSAIDLAKKIK